MSWALRVFEEWVAHRNDSATDEGTCQNPDSKLLNTWLCRFVTEVRKQNGSAYPPRSIHLTLTGVQRFILESNPDAPKFFDRTDSTYRNLQRSCDSVFRKLCSDGIGAAHVNQTSVFTLDEEQKLWDSGTFSTDNLTGLQRAVFFYAGKGERSNDS